MKAKLIRHTQSHFKMIDFAIELKDFKFIFDSWCSDSSVKVDWKAASEGPIAAVVSNGGVFFEVVAFEWLYEIVYIISYNARLGCRSTCMSCCRVCKSSIYYYYFIEMKYNEKHIHIYIYILYTNDVVDSCRLGASLWIGISTSWSVSSFLLLYSLHNSHTFSPCYVLILYSDCCCL